MSVEIEQVFEGAYFIQRGNRIRLRGEDMSNLPNVINTLEPILIERVELSLLRFSNMDVSKGTVIRSTSQGYAIWLKPGIGGKWFIGIDENLTACHVSYIHQLQRVYFGLFEEHLRYGGDEITPPSKSGKTYWQKPEHKVGFISVDATSPRDKGYKNGSTHTKVTELWLDELYYLTQDLRYLMRSERLGFAIWKIVNHSPLFEFEGKQWGLKLAAGRTISEADTIAAGKWLKETFMKSNIQVS